MLHLQMDFLEGPPSFFVSWCAPCRPGCPPVSCEICKKQLCLKWRDGNDWFMITNRITNTTKSYKKKSTLLFWKHINGLKVSIKKSSSTKKRHITFYIADNTSLPKYEHLNNVQRGEDFAIAFWKCTHHFSVHLCFDISCKCEKGIVHIDGSLSTSFHELDAMLYGQLHTEGWKNFPF